MKSRPLFLGLPLLLLLAGCGGDSLPPPVDADSKPASELPPAEALAAAPVDEPKHAAPAAEAVTPAETPAKDPNAMREVKYVVTPEGLKVEVAGVRFMAAAEAKQIGRGWGVKVSVKAEATDGKPHVLLNPKNGPIAFAAAVFKQGSTEAERIPDTREGEGELTLAPGTPVSFSREFPSKGGRVLGIGETLDLEVALWALGETTEDRRPVKQFFHVKMKVDKGKPKAKVEPPAAAAK